MKQIITALCVWCACAMPIRLCAQLTELDTLALQGRVSATGYLSTGNVERVITVFSGEISSVIDGTVGLKTSNTFTYGTFNRFQTESDLFSRNFVYLFPQERFYPYAMGWFETNYRRKIDFRYQLGLGGTFVAVREPHTIVKLSLTGSFESTDFRGAAFDGSPVFPPFLASSSPEVLTTLRLTGRVFGKHSLLDDKLRVEYEAWYQPSVLDVQDSRFRGNVICSVPITKALSLRASAEYAYERIILVGVKREDVVVTFGIAWTFFEK
jgi:hypothetical protein